MKTMFAIMILALLTMSVAVISDQILTGDLQTAQRAN